MDNTEYSNHEDEMTYFEDTKFSEDIKALNLETVIKEEYDVPDETFTFDSKMSIKEEIVNDEYVDVKPEVTIGTESCDVEYNENKISVALQHMVCHLTGSLYRCMLCNYNFKRRSLLEQHLQSSKHKKKLSYKCDLCEFESGNKKLLLKHNKMTHTESKIYNCAHCDFTCLSKKGFVKHTGQFCNGQEKWFECNICDFKSHRKYALAGHMSVHSAKKTKGVLSCSECSFTTVWTQALGSHRRNRKLKSIQCDICDYKACSKSGLLDHKKTHIGTDIGKLFFCDVCMYSTGIKAKFDEHKNTHPKKRVYRCDLCHFCTENINLLVTHIESHQKEH